MLLNLYLTTITLMGIFLAAHKREHWLTAPMNVVAALSWIVYGTVTYQTALVLTNGAILIIWMYALISEK